MKLKSLYLKIGAMLFITMIVASSFFFRKQDVDDYRILRVAVSPDFISTFNNLAKEFIKGTSYHIIVSSDATAALYAKIKDGEPFDIFFAANAIYPEKLKSEGLVQEDYIYAIGRLALWVPKHSISTDGAGYLHAMQFKRLAIANPSTIAYGRAAMETIQALKLKPALKEKIIQGDNTAQVFDLIANGDADSGFIALSQVLSYKKNKRETSMNDIWVVPPSYYEAIEQRMVLLKKPVQKPSALALFNYIKQPKIQEAIAQQGYEIKGGKKE